MPGPAPNKATKFQRWVLENVHHASFLRVRGTNTAELEPALDPKAENPWADLWFYSSPIFLVVR